MCGIIAYSGGRIAESILIDGLKRLEYRGYDSAGLAVARRKKMTVVRAVGKVSDLEKKLARRKLAGHYGMAHTRWATHGRPSEQNAHPHGDCQGKISIVHNGIIENYQDLKEELIAQKHVFTSQTDSEVVAHLVEEYFDGDLETAVLKTVQRLQGTFGLAVMHADIDRQIVMVKRGSPIIIGIGENEYFAASDAMALLPYTEKIISLNDDEMAVLNAGGYYIKNLNNELLEREIEICAGRDYLADKKGYEHFMLKEIFEQPEAIENAFRGRLVEAEGVSKLGGLEPVLERLKNMKKLIIVSCGTSYYAGLLGRYIFENLTALHVEVEVASEFRYRKLKMNEDTVVLALSQSGETADTIAAIREAKRKGALILGVVNVVGSAIAQITAAGVYNHAGPEFGVASTKIYTSQLVILTLIALLIGRYQDVSYNEGSEVIQAIKKLPKQVEKILADMEHVRALAQAYAPFEDFLFIGRLFNYPTAMEGALKLKEISYIHAEGYAAGEMKHGPISLIDENFPTVAIVSQDCTFDKMLSNIQEIKARNGRVLSVASQGCGRVRDVCDDVIWVPETLPLLQPILNIVPLQLFAYFIARERGCDIDKPRNLAKSVTVE
ncbi:MAG: glutamine--fructose-6-phosphate transaminase (isomerizing) [Candidatus Aminicenantes bacterium]|nr:glutamine--fructose-6-phosphate transaminase (isomerizing) [Candidatus Aminicenantes bacterium]